MNYAVNAKNFTHSLKIKLTRNKFGVITYFNQINIRFIGVETMRFTQQLIHNYLSSVKKRYSLIRLSHVPILLIVSLLSLQLLGCGTAVMQNDNYLTPNLPESELATIQIDTDGQWIQRINQVAFRINGKLALRKDFTEDTNNTINEVLVVPGKHTLSVLVLTDTYPDGARKDLQITTKLSVEVKAGTTYFLKGTFENSVDDDLTVELIDISTDEVISKSNLTTKSTFDRQHSEKSSGFSIRYEF